MSPCLAERMGSPAYLWPPGQSEKTVLRAAICRTPGLRINLELRTHWEAHFPLASQAERTWAP